MAIVELSEKPTLVFIPGAWHPPAVFEKVITLLKGLGYPCMALHLPSVGGKLTTTMTDDTAHIQKAITPLVEEGKDVVLITHSYSGIPGTESVKGLAKKDRQAAGQQGGVIAMVYLTAFLILPGQSLASFLGCMPDWITFDGDRMTVEKPQPVFYNGLPPETADKYASLLQHHAWPTFTTPLSYAAYRNVPSTYLICEQDAAIPLAGQQAMVAFGGEDLKKVVCSSGHSPMLTMPETVVDLIRNAAGEATGN